MIASTFHGPRDIRLIEVAERSPAATDVVVRVRAAGICGSDLHEYRAGRQLYAFDYPRPAQGHEFAGEVIAVGSSVTDLVPGDRVAVQPMIGCGDCEACRAGRFSLCPFLEHLGVARPGGFAEQAHVPRANAFRLPDGVSFDEAALLDCVAVAVHAVHRVPVPAGASVIVLGAGPIGLAVVQVARAAGAGHVTVVGRHQRSLELAGALGADRVVDDAERDALSEAEIVFQTGGGDGAIAQAASLLARGGTLGVVGESFSPAVIDPVRAMEWEQAIVFCWSYDTWAGRSEFGRALDLVASGRVQLAPTITHRRPLAELPEAYEDAADKARTNSVKVLVVP